MGEVNVGQALDLISSDKQKDRVEGLGGNEYLTVPSVFTIVMLTISRRSKTYSCQKPPNS